MKPWMLIAALVVAPLAMYAAPAFADDEAKRAKAEAIALADRIKELRKAEQVSELSDAVATVPDIYKPLADKSARGKLVGALADVVKDKDVGEARMAAVLALVELEDPKPAWKAMSRQLPDPDVEEATDLQIMVVKAAGTLAPSRATKALFELVQKSKDNRVSKEAAIALGGYGADKRGRTKILEELISMGRRIRPGRSTEKQVSQVAMDRWNEVGPGIVEGLNKLTNQELKDFEEWELLYEDNKKRLKDLFRED